MTKQNIIKFLITENAPFPNNAVLALIVFKQAFDPHERDLVRTIENAFYKNKWERSWRNGIYTFHHYHSTAHEVLCLYSGWVKVQFGGPGGQIATAETGDVIIVPVGVSHKNLDQSPDFSCVGAYPEGQSPDMQYGKPKERPHVNQNIRSIPLPKRDPVFGETGPLLEIWGKDI